MKTLVVYYSQSGQTRRYAEIIAKKMKADIFEIIPNRRYSDNMWIAWDEAQKERKNNKYPDILGNLPNIDEYDLILIGTGIWGYTMANPVISFINKTNFINKKTSSFWTYYDHDEKVNDGMRQMLKESHYVNGLPLPRSLTSNNDRTNIAIDNWIKTLH